MAFSCCSGFKPAAVVLSFLLVLLFSIQTTFARDTTIVEVTTDSGEELYLRDDRKPALYTQNFGDCLGSSTINVTRFDAAYYKDNMTVLFHLEGNTAVANESLMSTSQIFKSFPFQCRTKLV